MKRWDVLADRFLEGYSARGLADETVTYTYDAFGRQLTVTQTLTTHTRITENVYDTQGRLTSVKADIDGDATFDQQINYQYDPVTGQQTRVWTGTNSASPTTDTQYVYDTLGRLDQVEGHWRFGTQVDANGTADGSPPEVTDYVYDLVGNLAQTRRAGGVVTDYLYDDLNRLDILRHYEDDGDFVYEGPSGPDTLLSEFDYTVRADGKRTAVTEKVFDGTDTKTTDIQWQYDNLGRLIAEVYNAPGDGDALDFIDRYEYDLVGNRRGKDRVEAATDNAITAFLNNGAFDGPFNPTLEIDYVHDANDRLQTEKTNATGTDDDRFTVYGYDHTQQTSKTVHPGLDATGTPVEQTTYTYNLQGRMATASVDLDNDGTVDHYSEYEYDDSGIRVAQTELDDVNNDGDFEDVGTDTAERTDYLVDHHNPTGYAQVLEEMLDPDGDGNAASELAKSYTIGHDVFLETVAGNQLRHLLKDGHGSTRQLVDAFGNVIQHGQTPQIFAYDAYGNPHGFDPAAAATKFLYSGEQTDATGLQYLRARYYNPATGTFNRLDPFAGNMQDPQSLHKYLYVHGDPANAVDPTGMFIGGLSVTLISTSLRSAQHFGYAALMTTGVYAAIGALGGAGAYAIAGENPLVGAYNGALIAGGLRMAYMIKGSEGVWNALLDGTVDGTSRFLTEMIFAHRPGNNDHRTNGQIFRAATLKGIDSFASKVWSSATTLIGKPSWLKWADSPLGKGFMSAFDASITSVWGDVQKVPRPDNDIIVENAVLAAILSGASTGFKGALKAQFPDIPDKYSDDILRATLTMSLNVFVGFDAKGIAEFARFWGGW